MSQPTDQPESRNNNELARFFSWARERALTELENRLRHDPSLDPNHTFSDIMQQLLVEFRQTHPPDRSKNYG